MKKDLSLKIAFCVIMAAALLGLLFYGNRKEGYHVDELYSYGLANSEYLPFMHFGEVGYGVKDWMKEYGAGENLGDLFRNLARDISILGEAKGNVKSTSLYQDYVRAQANSADTKTTTWVSGSDYVDYLSPSKTNRFNYASVYYNQRGDVHPPLFYLALHTVCSFFPGVFSKWFGIFNNMVFMLLALFVLYRMVTKHLGGEMAAVCIVAAYGLSAAFVTATVFIRMYALLTLMILWCLDVHLDLVKKEFVLDKKLGLRLLFSLLLGYLTHYYFLLFAGMLALIICIWMMKGKKWKCLRQYVVTCVLTGVIGLAVWPFSVKHVFGGYRGQSSIAALKQGVNLYRLKVMTSCMMEDVLGGLGWMVWLFMAILIVGLVALFVKNGKSVLRTFPWGKTAMLLFPGMLYGLAVIQSAPFLDRRYVMCLYPLFFLLLFSGMLWLGRRWRIGGKETMALLVMSAILILCNNFIRVEPNNLYAGGQETTKVPEHCACVYVLPDQSWNASANETNVLAKCERVAVVYESNLESLRGTYERQSGETLMVAVLDGLDVETVLEKVREVFEVEDLIETDRINNCGSIKIYFSDRK